MSIRDMKLRHLALLGEMVQGISGEGSAAEDAIIALLPPETFRDAEELVNLIPTMFSCDVDALADFSGLREMTMTECDPLNGSASGSFCGDLARERVLLGICLCLLRSEGWLCAPKADGLPVEELKRTLAELSEKAGKKGHIAEIDVRQNTAFEAWLDKCQEAENQKESDKLAKTPLELQMVTDYRDSFPDEFAGKLALTQFLFSRGCFSRAASHKHSVIQYRSKRDFLPAMKGGYSAQVIGDGDNWGNRVDRHVLDALLAAIVKNKFPDLLKASGAEGKGKKSQHPGFFSDGPSATAVEKAGQWLSDRGVGADLGIIVTPRRMVLNNVLNKDVSWVSRWVEPVGLAGFAGRYQGHPVWESPFVQPVVVAIDLADLKVLKVNPCVLEGRWCSKPQVSTQVTEQDIEDMEKNRLPHSKPLRPDHYCKVTFDIFVDVELASLSTPTVAKHSECFVISEDTASQSTSQGA